MIIDATGQPLLITGAESLGVPPSINPALVDPNTGQLLSEAVPIKPPIYQTAGFWMTVGMIGLIVWAVKYDKFR